MPTARANGLDINYDVGGVPDGAPVILIMGLAIRGAGWRMLAPLLRERHPVAWFDNRGCGHTTLPDAPWTMTDMAADVTALMDHLGWDQAHVVGVSMGGMIAQHVGLTQRERVLSLSLIATTPGGVLGRLPKPRGVYYMARALAARDDDARFRAMAKLLFPKPHREALGHDWIVETLTHDLTPRPPAAGRKGQLRAVFGHNTSRRLAELAGIPTLVVKPDEDILVRPSRSDQLHAGIPGSRLVTLSGLGHGLIRHAGPRLADPLLEHFAAVDAGRAAA